ncbi:hypothetical protein Dimus_000903 [Dionaea muscipula]
MVLEIEKPRVTEIQVRMDCNGCVQKIKKTLSSINGIYDFQIDLAQQKITMIGWADIEKIVKAIKKTRKVVTICSHMEVANPPAQAAEAAPGPPDNAIPPPTEAPAPVAEPPKDDQPPPPPAEAAEPPQDQLPSPKSQQPSGPNDVGEVHMTLYHHPPDHGYMGQYSQGPSFRHERAPPVYIVQNYHTYQPSSSYLMGHRYNIQSPVPMYTSYGGMEMSYQRDYDSGSSSRGNITSVFSDENPNACIIS